MRGNISRKRFFGTAAAGVGAVAGMAGSASAIGGDEPWENKVYPSGNARTDRSNIEQAIKNNRFVILGSTSSTARGTAVKMAFDLRGQNPIKVSKSVTIIGEDAKIKADGAIFSCDKNIRLSIRNVYVEGSNTIPIETESVGGVAGLNIMNLAIGGDEPWE